MESFSLIGCAARVVRPVSVLAAVLLLGACASTGPIDNPVIRKFSWFNYVNGSDIRFACSKGSADRIRFIYNAVYGEQIRVYDLGPGESGTGHVLTERVIGPADVSSLSLDDPLAPWRGVSTRRLLTTDESDELLASLVLSGFGTPPPEGLDLRSWDFYWVVSACLNGLAWFNAYAFPSDRFAAITFDVVLKTLDETGVAFRPPRPVEPSSGGEPAGRLPDETAQYFTLRAGPGGLHGLFTGF